VREQKVSEISFQQEEALFAAAKKFVCSNKKFCL
jgi:hypothetical protein